MHRRPRLRTILLAVNLVILALPLGGVTVLRLYESALVRQTESELLGQAAILAAAYRAALARARPDPAGATEYGVPAAPEWLPAAGAGSRAPPRSTWRSTRCARGRRRRQRAPRPPTRLPSRPAATSWR